MPHCDGCGLPVEDSHYHQRIARLELATRFRPLHIKYLILSDAPPARPEDYFFRPSNDRSVRSLPSRMFFDELAVAAGMSHDAIAGTPEESVLAEFQRAGFFLAHAVECPVADPARLREDLNRLAPTVLLRLRSSYKPKHVVPVGKAISEIIPFLQMSEVKDLLILNSGAAFYDPFLGDPQNQTEFGTALGSRLAQALGASPSAPGARSV